MRNENRLGITQNTPTAKSATAKFAKKKLVLVRMRLFLIMTKSTTRFPENRKQYVQIDNCFHSSSQPVYGYNHISEKNKNEYVFFNIIAVFISFPTPYLFQFENSAYNI